MTASLQLRAASEAVRSVQRDLVTAGATVLKKAVLARAAKVVGADMAMSNMRTSAGTPKKLTVRFDVKGTDNPAALLKAFGPWGVPEHGASPHVIAPRAGKVSGRGTARVRRQRDLDRAFGARGAYSGLRPMPAGSTFAYRVKHPGTTGKKPFTKGIAEATPEAVEAMTKLAVGAVVQAVTKVR